MQGVAGGRGGRFRARTDALSAPEHQEKCLEVFIFAPKIKFSQDFLTWGARPGPPADGGLLVTTAGADTL